MTVWTREGHGQERRGWEGYPGGQVDSHEADGLGAGEGRYPEGDPGLCLLTGQWALLHP